MSIKLLLIQMSANSTIHIDLFTRVVKEEIVDEKSKLPSFNGRIITWVGHIDIYEKLCRKIFRFTYVDGDGINLRGESYFLFK